MTLEEIEKEFDKWTVDFNIPVDLEARDEAQKFIRKAYQSGIALGREEVAARERKKAFEVIEENAKRIRSQIIHDAIEVGEKLKLYTKDFQNKTIRGHKSHNEAISDYQEAIKKLIQ
jgi:hypothetical protein